jgi:hypothetical protein
MLLALYTNKQSPCLHGCSTMISSTPDKMRVEFTVVGSCSANEHVSLFVRLSNGMFFVFLLF